MDGTEDVVEVDARNHVMAVAIAPYTWTQLPQFGCEVFFDQPFSVVLFFHQREDEPE